MTGYRGWEGLWSGEHTRPRVVSGVSPDMDRKSEASAGRRSRHARRVRSPDPRRSESEPLTLRSRLGVRGSELLRDASAC